MVLTIMLPPLEMVVYELKVALDGISQSVKIGLTSATRPTLMGLFLMKYTKHRFWVTISLNTLYRLVLEKVI